MCRKCEKRGYMIRKRGKSKRLRGNNEENRGKTIEKRGKKFLKIHCRGTPNQFRLYR